MVRKSGKYILAIYTYEVQSKPERAWMSEYKNKNDKSIGKSNIMGKREFEYSLEYLHISSKKTRKATHNNKIYN